MQSTSIRRLGVTGLSTTYVTGTLITVALGVSGSADGRLDAAGRAALLLIVVARRSETLRTPEE